jgi:serine/threonine protein kinase
VIGSRPLKLEPCSRSASGGRCANGARPGSSIAISSQPTSSSLLADGEVLDFGLAKLTDTGGDQEGVGKAESELTRTGAVMGTPSYMSPEQARGSVWTIEATSSHWGY